MPYLIDGHNVIGKMPDLTLDDPQDEAKLAALVRQFCIRQKRKATLIFDGGLPGGVSALSNPYVTVIFASDRHTTADDLILNRLRAEKNPAGLILVTSDHKLVTAARQRRMAVISAAEFARQLRQAARPAERREEKERRLSQTELAEWEAMFKRKTKK